MTPDYFIQQLIDDPSFERWVRDPEKYPDEVAYWVQWLQSHPEHNEAVAEARALLLQIHFQKQVVPQYQINDSWKKVASKISTSEEKIIWSSGPWMKYAASVTLLISVLTLSWFWLSDDFTEYQTAFGETTTVLLDDGTQVALNGNSRLTVASDWLDNNYREVFLEGEAYFSVNRKVKNETSIPFRVKTSNLQVNVLGTQFNVNSRRGQTQVVLDEGKVVLAIPDKNEASMQPGEYVMYSSENKRVTRRQVNPEIYTAWRKQQLVLDDTPVSHIIRQLEDTYGLSFILSDESVRDRRISSTGSISTEDLESVLMALSTLLQVEIDREKSKIYIYEN